MKRFLYSFLGAMAGIWVSVLIGGALLFFTIVVLMSTMISKGVEIESNSILRIPLSGTVVDRISTPSVMDVLQQETESQLSLDDLVYAIRTAKDDKRITAIYLDCGELNVGLAQCKEIIDALLYFKTSGKKIYAYSDNYSQADYFIASAANTMVLNPIGMVDIHGLSASTFFFKDLLDKLGVEVQVVKVGTYKSAVEPFLLSDMSEANREQVSHFLGSMWRQVANDIAKYRNTKSDSVNSWADSFAFTQPTQYYVDHGMVNKLSYRQAFEKSIGIGNSDPDKNEKNIVELKDYISSSMSLLNTPGGDKKIAILYAIGEITESDRDGIASDRIVPVINKLIEEDEVDGLILRVNSGGGSAFASEQIWEALNRFKADTGKPFYVSMGDMAASGGYYISCGADKIFASPLTLTGSIGIFGMIPNVQPLLSKHLGVNVATVSTNTGNSPTLFAAMTPQQRNAMQSYVDRGYELFVERCATGRHLKVDQIKAVAEGRVWDGKSALEHGLVDKLGGLEDAITAMAAQLKVDKENLDIVKLPDISSEWWEALLELDSQMKASMFSLSPVDPTSAFGVKMYNKLRNMYPIQSRADYIYIQ